MCALHVVQKAHPTVAKVLKKLVHSVRLENATSVLMSATPEQPRAAPLRHPSSDYTALFDAIIDPSFDEDEYMGRAERPPPMLAIGDHCSL